MQRVVPKYPARSAERREEGATWVHIRVDESGRVVDTAVATSSGHKRLDGAALAAVRKWKFAQLPAGTAPGRRVGRHGGALRPVPIHRTHASAKTRRVALYDEEVKTGAKDEQTPEVRKPSTRFIADVAAGNLTRCARHHA